MQALFAGGLSAGLSVRKFSELLRGNSRENMGRSVSYFWEMGYPGDVVGGLLDELHLLVHPIAVRKGMRLFEESQGPGPTAIDLLADVRDRRDKPRLRP